MVQNFHLHLVLHTCHPDLHILLGIFASIIYNVPESHSKEMRIGPQFAPGSNSRNIKPHPSILPAQVLQQDGQFNRLHPAAQNILVMPRKKQQMFYQHTDTSAFIRDALQSLFVFLSRTSFQQTNLTFTLNRRQRIVQFMRSIADKSLLGLKSRVQVIQHLIQRTNEFIPFIFIPEGL